MNKCHTPITWHNDTTPAINETNLNYMDGCIDTIDDRVVAIANDPPANALKAEGWAIGEQSGVPVTSGSPYYENNSKYYSQESANEVLKSEGFANGTQNGTPVTSGPYYENNAKYWKEQAQAIASASLSGLSDVSITNPQDGDCLVYDADNSEWKNGMPVKDTTVTGNPLSFTTQSAGVSSHTVITLEPMQSGSGDPSPSNVRPISGYDEINLIIPRKNLFDNSRVEFGAIDRNTGEPVATTDYQRIRDIIVQPNTTYTLSGLVDPYNQENRVFFYDEQHNYFTTYLSFNTSEYTFTTPANCKYLSARWYIDANISNAQLELGSSATTYEAYNPETNIKHVLSNTVYGGTLDVETGVLTVDKGAVDLGTLNWERYSFSGVYAFYAAISNAPSQAFDVVCSRYKNVYATASQLKNYEVTAAMSSNNYVYIRDDTYTSSSAFKTAVTGSLLVFPLTTPITYQLTPYQVSLLSGANVATSNGTTIQLTYRQGTIASQTDLVSIAGSVNNLADMVNETSTRFDNSICSTHALGERNTTGAQINSGSYFYLNGVFCKALSNIASNASFTKNTNYKETTIAAELIELFNS